jgi:hypothetical protein
VKGAQRRTVDPTASAAVWLSTAPEGVLPLGEHEGPLTVIVSKDNWQPSRTDVTLQAGATRPVPTALDPYASPA